MEVEIELVFGWLSFTPLVGRLQVEVLGRLLEAEIVDGDPGCDPSPPRSLLGLQRMNDKLTTLVLHLLLVPQGELAATQVPDYLPGCRRRLGLEPDLELHGLTGLLQVASGQLLLALLRREDDLDLEQ